MDDILKIHDILQKLKSTGCIAFIDPNIATDIYTDASDAGAGFLAIQNGKIVSMESTKFNSKLFSEATTDRELSAIDLAVAKLNDRINWRETIIYTDHLPLVQLLNKAKRKDLTLHGRRARVVLRIDTTGCIIRHIEGKKNVIADHLSRNGWVKTAPLRNLQLDGDIESNPGPRSSTNKI